MKIRIRFAKLGRVRWTSHRDVARMWERALRRARLPLSYTEGFSPRPKLSFGLALPTGCESKAEYLDVALSESVESTELTADFSSLLPDGVDVLAAQVLPTGTGSLQEEVTSCRWEIDVPQMGPDALAEVIDRVLGAETLSVTRERKGRPVTDDMRPSVLALSSRPSGAAAELVAELGTRPRGVRPAELAQVMGIELGLACRTNQWIECDGSRGEPLTTPVPDAAAWERAS
ncbi:MAG TPA: TIGR03936 family radical SAM-associated protein [Acidimicrobiales bacterium]|nr:TIGR03936 family radical SAM-associated protein [Acidimicrobiales bacterium]HVC70701.1 TIGR03936 family radical SAM-associated protein [Acidimicrobiales bacterium]